MFSGKFFPIGIRLGIPSKGELIKKQQIEVITQTPPAQNSWLMVTRASQRSPESPHGASPSGFFVFVIVRVVSLIGYCGK